jgi:hypothetical protein
VAEALRVVAVTTDLMDRSKIGGAIDGVRVVRPGAPLDDADVVIVDLALPGFEAAVATGARVIAYGSHVDEATLAAARDSGAEAMPRSVFFRRLSDGTLLS